MKIISKTIKLFTLGLLVLGVTACNNDDDTPQVITVDDVISISADLTILEEALNLTGLDALLRQSGPYTVFAPNDDAFIALLGTNPAWNSLTDIPPALLQSVLLNHVVGGSVLESTDIISEGSGYLSTASTVGPNDTNLSLFYNVNGTTVEINGGDGTMTAPRNGADVISVDLVGSNGVVHIINKVLLAPTIVDMALANPDLSNLVVSLTTAGQPDFVSILGTPNGTSPAPFTVFAPNNAAFVALLASDMSWNSPADIPTALLTSVLQHHVIDGANVRSSGLTDGMMPPTFEGDAITINLPGNDGNPAKITDGSGTTDIDIIAVDIQTANGVIHVVESVLIPNTNN